MPLRPHAPGTVRRRLTTWSILTRWRGLTGAFGAPSLESTLRLAVLASARPRQQRTTIAGAVGWHAGHECLRSVRALPGKGETVFRADGRSFNALL
ncbi:hypothetical protein GHK53_12565 [Sinorhizobium meliloti]|uniref:Uncharacterized protein n=1 Tax=Rhizobium meliloti TaxID=382 RepID=A0AAW9TNX8_RHIML|nr:hypothetical protein [Sinorhizobium meliloti]